MDSFLLPGVIHEGKVRVVNKQTGCETQRWGLNWVKYKSGGDMFLGRIGTAWHRKAMGNSPCPTGRNGLEVSTATTTYTHTVVYHCAVCVCVTI